MREIPVARSTKTNQHRAAILEYAKKENMKSWALALAFFFITTLVVFEVTFGLFGSFWWLNSLPLILLAGLGIAMLVGYIVAPIALSRGGVKVYTNPPPKLAKMLDELSYKSGFKSPKLMLLDTPEANAAAYHNIFGRRIIVTRGLVDLYQKGEITDEEMESILAHELGHLKFLHIVKGSLVMSWSSIFYYIGVVVVGVGMITVATSSKKEDLGGGVVGAALAVVGAFLVVVSIIAKIIGFVNLRRQEHEADAYSIAVTGNTQLGSALQKIEEHNIALTKEETNPLPNRDSWTVRPRTGSWIERLFDIHPSTAKRIEKIKALKAHFLSEGLH